MAKKISIIIPVYNGSDYLAEAIESSLAQTYKNIEILVINDGSRDSGKTARVAKKYLPKIRYFAKKNGGVASAMNFGIKHMKGDYFSWLSHDDVYYPEKVAHQVAFIQKKSSKTILYCDFELIDKMSQHIAFAKITPPPSSQFVYNLIVKRFLHGCSLLIPREAFKEAGCFDITLKNAQDYELWLRMVRNGYIFTHQKEILLASRIHPNQGTNLRRDIQRQDEEYVYGQVLKEFKPREIFGQMDQATGYLKLSYGFGRAGLKKAANDSRRLAFEKLKISNFVINLKPIIASYFSDQKFSLSYWKKITYQHLNKIFQ